ncbi:MAG: Fur family transcriptional regulator [Erysipelotrichaceae bacterium]
MTKYALKILDIINNSTSHLTAEHIFMLLKNDNNNVALATVYNNLNYLLKNGYISTITVDNKAVHYDKVIRHDHLICRHCKKISDVQIKDLTSILKQQLNIDILNYQLNIDYICQDCQKLIKS